MGSSNEKLLYEAINRYDTDAVRVLLYQSNVDPNTNLRPYLHGKNIPDNVIPLKECLNKINSPPEKKSHSTEHRLDLRARGGVILKMLIEKGAKVDKDDVLLVLEGYRKLKPVTKRPAWDTRPQESPIEDPNVEHLKLLLSAEGGIEAVTQVKEVFRVWESEVGEKEQADHRWQLDVKIRQKAVLDGLQIADLIVTVSDESIDSSSKSCSHSPSEERIYAL